MNGLAEAGVLPDPGTPSFFPSLLAQIRGAAPHVALDPVLLQALLLCLLAGNKNLILRTREDDIGLVSKLTVSTVTSVFGYQVHKVKIKPDTKYQTPLEFLRALFLPTIPTPGSGSLADEVSTIGHKPKSTHKRRIESHTSSAARLSLHTQPIHRTFSNPEESPVAALSHATAGSTADSKSTFFFDSAPRTDTASMSTQRPPLRPAGVNTDPAPALARQLSLDTLVLPRILVISGLENVAVPAQRALLKMLTDKRLVLDDIEGDWVWNLPEGFLVVYVCAADPRERPAIHKSLLDRFAMSTTINLHPATLQTVRHTLPYHRHSISASASLHVPQDSSPVSPILSAEFLRSLCALASAAPGFGVAHRTNIHPTLSLYISDLFSATRHHPQLDAMLLSARARQDADALVRAARVIGGDPTGIEFITVMGKGAEAKARGEPAFSDIYAYGPGYEDSLSADMEWEHVNRSQVSAVPSEGKQEEQPLDVSEADIARIVPRVLSHRLRVRDGPEHEVLGSLRHGAVNTRLGGERGEEVTSAEGGFERDTIKNILVKILSEV